MSEGHPVAQCRLSPLLAIASEPAEQPISSLVALWEVAGIHVDYIVYDEGRSDAELANSFREAIASHRRTRELTAQQLIIGGFSRGGRIAATLATSEAAAALLCLGFPFHKRGDPQDRHGLRALQGLACPTLIVQGTRDAHGNREIVRSYDSLPPCIRLHWLEDGNHRWQTRKKNATNSDKLLRSAADATIEFFRSSVPSADHA